MIRNFTREHSTFVPMILGDGATVYPVADVIHHLKRSIYLVLPINHFEQFTSNGVPFSRVCKQVYALMSRLTSSGWLSFNPGTVPAKIVTGSHWASPMTVGPW